MPGQILSAIICVTKPNIIGKSAYARIQIFLSGIGVVSGRIMFYCLFTVLYFVIYLANTLDPRKHHTIPGADSAGLHRACAGTEDGRETESGVYGRSAQGGEKRHFLTIRK